VTLGYDARMTLIRAWDEYGGHRSPDEDEVTPEPLEVVTELETPAERVAEPLPDKPPVTRKRTPRKQRRVPSAAALKAAQAKLQ
jgi:hypothetical protein